MTDSPDLARLETELREAQQEIQRLQEQTRALSAAVEAYRALSRIKTTPRDPMAVPDDSVELIEWSFPQLLAVLQAGAKHGGKWRRQTVGEHEGHFVRHADCSTPFGICGQENSLDDDGNPHWAHAAVRLLMAAFQEKFGVKS